MIWMPNKRSCRCLREEDGQSTLEYLMVLLGIIAMIVALYALVRAGATGTLGQLAQQSASHVLSTNGLLDVFLF